MKLLTLLISSLVLFSACSLVFDSNEELVEKNFDFRNEKYGKIITKADYSDQPYIVILDDGTWLCTLTIGKGNEGSKQQTIASTYSKDNGKTWSELNLIESFEGPESSWAVPFKNKYGRVYVFYTFNGDGVQLERSDSVGWYVFKYTDDNGMTWSEKRFRVNIPLTFLDQYNELKGEAQFFWGVDKPTNTKDGVYWGVTKISGQHFSFTEGWHFFSPNLFFEQDPEKIEIRLFPEDTEFSIFKSPFNTNISEEHNLVELNSGELYMVYRTVDGMIAETYTTNSKNHWSTPGFAKYRSGKFIKNPRAFPLVTKFSNGKYLLWFHNNGGKDFQGRNPVWISGGIEENGKISWSEPEILLYGNDLNMRFSYPDWVEENNNYWFTFTDKKSAKIIKTSPLLLNNIWDQGKIENSINILSTSLDKDNYKNKKEIFFPGNPEVAKGMGQTFEYIIRFNDLSEELLLLNNSENLKLLVNTSGQLEINTEDNVLFFPIEANKKDDLVYLTIIIDSQTNIIMFVNNGVLFDGNEKERGWYYLEGNYYNSFTKPFTHYFHSNSYKNQILYSRIYNNSLSISEAVNNYKLLSL